MQPVLFSIGSLHIFSFSIFLMLGWCAFSFIFWKQLHDKGTDDERIFDLTFYATIFGLIAARLGYVVTYQEVFLASPLKIASIWIAPGLALYPGLTGGLVTMFLLARRVKIRIVTLLDALSLALPVGLLVGLIGSLLDGAEIGKLTSLPWAVRYVGHLGPRHPVQLYEMGGLIIIMIILSLIHRLAKKHAWPYGISGLWFFLLLSIVMFVLEFLKETELYWVRLSLNQWYLIALFAETLGALYVRGGGREFTRPLIHKARRFIYDKFRRRHA